MHHLKKTMEIGIANGYCELHVANSLQDAHDSFIRQFGAETSQVLLRDFVAAMETLLTEIELQVHQRDKVELKRLTHRIIGLCPIYMAKEAAMIGQMIEDELKVGDWVKISQLQEQLRNSFKTYLIS